MCVCTKVICTNRIKSGMMIVMPSVDVRTLTQDTTDVRKGRTNNVP